MSDGTFDIEKLRSIGVVKGGRTWRTKDQVVESRDENGDRIKATTDQLGNTVTEHNNKKDQVDVTVRPGLVQMEG